MSRIDREAIAQVPFTQEEWAKVLHARASFQYFLEEVYPLSFEDETYFMADRTWQPFRIYGLHREWAAFVEHKARVCIIAPRSHLKSTVVGRGFSFWQLFKGGEGGADVEGVYFSYKDNLARDHTQEIKNYILANPYCRFWVDNKPTSESLVDFDITFDGQERWKGTVDPMGILGAARGRHPNFCVCLVPGTKVKVKENGRLAYKLIGNIEVGDLVLSHRGHWRKVVATYERHHKGDMVRMWLGGGEIVEATPNHRFLTVRGWVPAGELRVHDVLYTVSRTKKRRRQEKTDARKGDNALNERLRELVPLRNGRYVKQIERFHYDGLVYNLEVETDQSYAGRCWIAHNCDDILSDFSKPLEAPEILRINRVFRQVVMSMPQINEPLILIGTPQAENDILHQLKGDERWCWARYPAIYEVDGERRTQWPEKFDLERLNEILSEIKDMAFGVEYLLKPVVLTDLKFPPDLVRASVSEEATRYSLDEPFDNPDNIPIYGGMDVGKEAHPSHISILALHPSGTLIQIYETWIDHMKYNLQAAMVNRIMEHFGVRKFLYDSTRAELDDRRLHKRAHGIKFKRANKAHMMNLLEARLAPQPDEPGIVLLGPKDSRQVRQISAIRKDLKAYETEEGHGDSAWSLALAVYAAESGPTFTDFGDAGAIFGGKR